MGKRFYTVAFTFDEDYTPKAEGFKTITIVVLAENQFTAMQTAWAKLAVLDLPEPKSFTARATDKC